MSHRDTNRFSPRSRFLRAPRQHLLRVAFSRNERRFVLAATGTVAGTGTGTGTASRRLWRLDGGGAQESNLPGMLLAPHTGFEVRGQHQHVEHLRGGGYLKLAGKSDAGLAGGAAVGVGFDRAIEQRRGAPLKNEARVGAVAAEDARG
jgi:hypothetical protein